MAGSFAGALEGDEALQVVLGEAGDVAEIAPGGDPIA
jgi:hypothetical protein